jgi:hypothetical protein
VGISQATSYLWKKQYVGLGVLELRELRQLREENSRLHDMAEEHHEPMRPRRQAMEVPTQRVWKRLRLIVVEEAREVAPAWVMAQLDQPGPTSVRNSIQRRMSTGRNAQP